MELIDNLDQAMWSRGDPNDKTGTYAGAALNLVCWTCTYIMRNASESSVFLFVPFFRENFLCLKTFDDTQSRYKSSPRQN